MIGLPRWFPRITTGRAIEKNRANSRKLFEQGDLFYRRWREAELREKQLSGSYGNYANLKLRVDRLEHELKKLKIKEY